MKRAGLFLSMVVLAALLLAACGGEQTSTSVPGSNAPSATVEAASTEMATDVAITETAGTPDLTTTANVPVTGDESPNRLTNLMDYAVRNQNGDQIGDVNNMVLDFDNATISYAVVGTGGFLGLGEKNVLVPWDMLQFQTGDSGATGVQNAFVFTGNQDAYNNFPETDLSTLLPGTGQTAASWDTDIQNYWQNGGAGIGQATNTPAGGTDGTAAPNTTAVPGTGNGTQSGQSAGAHHGD